MAEVFQINCCLIHIVLLLNFHNMRHPTLVRFACFYQKYIDMLIDHATHDRVCFARVTWEVYFNTYMCCFPLCCQLSPTLGTTPSRVCAFYKNYMTDAHASRQTNRVVLRAFTWEVIFCNIMIVDQINILITVNSCNPWVPHHGYGYGDTQGPKMATLQDTRTRTTGYGLCGYGYGYSPKVPAGLPVMFTTCMNPILYGLASTGNNSLVDGQARQQLYPVWTAWPVLYEPTLDWLASPCVCTPTFGVMWYCDGAPERWVGNLLWLGPFNLL